MELQALKLACALCVHTRVRVTPKDRLLWTSVISTILPRMSEVTLQGPSLLLGLPTPGVRKSAWSKVTAAPATCPSPCARSQEPGQPVPEEHQAGGEREGRGLGRGCHSPVPQQPPLATIPGATARSVELPSLVSLQEAEDIRAAVCHTGKISRSWGLVTERCLTYTKHSLKFLKDWSKS